MWSEPAFYGSAKTWVNPGSKHYIQLHLLRSEQQVRETEQHHNKSRYTASQPSFREWNSSYHSLSSSQTKLEIWKILRYSLKGLHQKCIYQFCVTPGFECSFAYHRPLVFQQKQIKVNILHIFTVILPLYPPVYSLRSDETASLPKLLNQLITSLESMDTRVPRRLDKETNSVVCNPINIKAYINKRFPSFAGLLHKLGFFKEACLAARSLFTYVGGAGTLGWVLAFSEGGRAIRSDILSQRICKRLM